MGCALALARQGFTQIHVWETAREIGEVGAGINITPNLSRILDSWGVLDIARDEAVALDGASVLGQLHSRACSTQLTTDGAQDHTLTAVDFRYIEEEFGYPFYVSLGSFPALTQGRPPQSPSEMPSPRRHVVRVCHAASEPCGDAV